MLGKSNIYSRWVKEMKRQGLFHPGQRVGVAVSGGPDSVVLLHFMKDLALEWGITLAVVHFNHHLRGAESDADESFVRNLADSIGIAFIGGEAEVARVAREKKQNLEATARELRYRFFFSLVDQGRLDKVVTAHTANDQAETVLMRLLRGAGRRGLSGIYPVLEGKVARPFLDLTRAEITREIEARKLECRLDSSNLDTRLRRNKIRRELLPLLEREFNPALIPLLKIHADRARDEEAFLEQQARERSRPWRIRDGAEEKIPVRALRFATGAQSGRSLTLPGGAVARKEFDWLILGSQSISAAEDAYEYPATVPGEITVPQLGVTFRFKIIDPQRVPKEYNGMGTSAMDAQKLPHRLLLRNWRAGDRFWPLGSRKLRKLKELFGQRKIPLSQRKLWPVVECGEQIVWVRGFAPAASVAASAESRAILLIEEARSPRG
jgi:tRNA(Ile)-lysidine synthase